MIISLSIPCISYAGTLEELWWTFPDKTKSGSGSHGDDDDRWHCSWHRVLNDGSYNMTLRNAFDYSTTNFIGSAGIFAGTEGGKKMGKKIKKLVVVTGLVSMMFGGLIGKTDNESGFGTITAYAAEQTLNQSPRWECSGDVWRVKNNAGGYLINSWFQDDVTGHWYMLGADGIMFSGLVTDQSTGKSYLLNTNHDGTYGRMLTINGVYNINGKEIYLEFNQAHDGSYGAITSGLSEVRGTGVKETGLESIPTDSAENVGSDNSGYTADEIDNIFNDGDPAKQWVKDHPDASYGSGGNIGANWDF